MTIWQHCLGWIESTGIAVAIRESLWLYPTLEILHIIGFVVLVGAAAMFDMRLLGISSWLPVDAAAHHLLRWSRASLFLVVPSGLLLFISGATEMWANPAFRLKLILLAGAGVNAYVFHRWSFRRVGEWNRGAPTPARARVRGLDLIGPVDRCHRKRAVDCLLVDTAGRLRTNPWHLEHEDGARYTLFLTMLYFLHGAFKLTNRVRRYRAARSS